MKEKPILFSGPMVRAILEGRKSMTRRAVKPHVSADTVRFDYYSADSQWREMFVADNLGNLYPKSWSHKCPYGVPGDRLWVRETHGFASGDGPGGDPTSWVEYRADGESDEIRRWRPSIFMPRWASRITLEVTGVRVERLREISERDAEREGVYRIPAGTDEDGFHYDASDYRSAFVQLWDSINGRGVRKIIGDGTVQTHNKKHREEKPDVSWAANPWVWVVEFMRVDQA